MILQACLYGDDPLDVFTRFSVCSQFCCAVVGVVESLTDSPEIEVEPLWWNITGLNETWVAPPH